MNCNPAHTVYTLVNTPYNPPPTYTKISGLNYTKLELSPSAYLAAKGNKTVATNAAGTTTLSLSASTITLPASGLYTIHSQPGQQYLVVTDPRFTSYQNFISSDYVLSRLSLDPQQIQKRLGDGFYEQKLVNDQITGQTGKRFLDNYSDSQTQFIALLDAGIKAAQDFQLVPGIALTTQQLDALSQDIVWMVERDITLPDGKIERVLAPQVYLSRLHEADLKPNGALIAANDISITASGDITNSGSILGRNSNVLSAKGITNQGGVIGSQGFTLLKADNDIFNLSGNINGKNVGLAAGRDIINQRTSRDVTRTIDLGQQGGTGFGLLRLAPVVGVVTGTELGLEAGISATDGLSLNAGRDISIIGATIASGGDTALNAGRDLTLSILTASESASTTHYAASRSSVTQLGSNIQTGGKLNMQSGNDLRLTSATLDVGKDATLISGGDLTLASGKNSTQFSFDTGIAQHRSLDETVVGTTLNAKGNITMAAVRPDYLAPVGEGGGEGSIKTGNVTLQSANISSANGKLAVIADNDVNITTTDEEHKSFTQTRVESSGFFSSTTTTTRDEINRTHAMGGKLVGDTVIIQSGHDINVTGSAASAKQDLTLAAMNDINILAATETYKETHKHDEVTNGLISGGSFGFTIGQDKQTTQTDTDGTTQSQSRSTLNSNNGSINLLSGNNTLIVGSDLAATQDKLTVTTGGGIGIFAGQDTLNQYTETHHDQDTGLFSNQKRVITDTLIQSLYAGSTLTSNNIDINAGVNLVLQAAQLNSKGDTNLAAGGDLKLLSANDRSYTKHTETLQTDGLSFNSFGMFDVLADRRKNSSTTSNVETNQVTSINSSGNLNTRSAGNTLIEASTLNAGGSINLSAGYDANGQLTKPDATVTIATVKDSNYLSIEDKHSSLAWQSQNGSGHYTETVELAIIGAGRGLSVNAAGGVVVDIPEVPATSAPAASSLFNAAQLKPTLTAEEAAQAEADKNTQDAQRFNEHIQNLTNKLGQEWIGQLARDPKINAQFKQVSAAAEHWDYSHEGLTPEAAGVITIVVAYCTAGAGSSMVGTTTATAGTTTTAVGGTTLATTATTTAGVSVTTYTVAGAAINAGISTLASQASIFLINNKGDLSKTLDDMGKSENVKNVIAAMLTAGVGTAMPSTSMTGVLAQTATSCATGEMVGIGCERGATNAAVTSGAALAYTTMVGYTADLRPGENRNGTKADGTSTGNATYVPVPDKNSPTFGQQLPADVGMNVIGLNRPDTILSQGGAISKVLNQVPFVNAAAGWHDYIFNASPLLNDWFTVVNVPAMIPAAMLAIPASLNDPSVSWLFTNGLPHTLDTPPKPSVIPSIINLPNMVSQPVLSVNTQGGRP